MKLLFTEEHKLEELHKIYLEEDDVSMECEYIEKDGEDYAVWGSAVIEGEIFNEFRVVFNLIKAVEDESIESIMNSEWDWYDFDFS